MSIPSTLFLESLQTSMQASVARIVCAKTCAEAARRLAEEPFELCIVDWKLPDGDGCDFIRTMDGKRKTMSIFLISAFANELPPEVHKLLALEPDCILQKPFDPAVLLHSLRTLRS